MREVERGADSMYALMFHETNHCERIVSVHVTRPQRPTCSTATAAAGSLNPSHKGQSSANQAPAPGFPTQSQLNRAAPPRNPVRALPAGMRVHPI